MGITIIPLPNSQPLIGDWFEKGLRKFEGEINDRIHPCNTSDNEISRRVKLEGTDGYGNRSICGDCCIEFFYYYDSTLTNIPEYKNALWIKVHNINGLNIWIRVGFNKKDKKKAQIYSQDSINCKLLEYALAYALPQFFTPNGIWMSDKRIRVKNVPWSVIIDEICVLLKCACIAIKQ